MPQKKTFDWMRQQLSGHMRTQIIAAAATLSLADYLQDGPRTVDEIDFTKTDAGRDFALGMQALKRLAQPDDIGGVVAFLASDDAR